MNTLLDFSLDEAKDVSHIKHPRDIVILLEQGRILQVPGESILVKKEQISNHIEMKEMTDYESNLILELRKSYSISNKLSDYQTLRMTNADSSGINLYLWRRR